MGYSQAVYELSSGYKMPVFGLGTYLITDKRLIMSVIDEALAIGYRLIDTAAMYGNEYEIGVALKKLLPKHKLSRQDIFLISKLPPTSHGQMALDTMKESIERLQCGYLDLYLIHWPGSTDLEPRNPANQTLREETWAKLVEGQHEGLVRSLGVSNFTINHLAMLLKNCYGVKPAVNQIEWHPHCHQDDMRQFCNKEGILIQGYFSFGGSDNKFLLRDPTIIALAEKIGKSPAQVLLVWALQQNVAVIPKASSRNHLQANVDINFCIVEHLMKQLSNLPQKRYGSDPNCVY